MAQKKDNTIPTAFGHFDDLLKSFIKQSTNVFDDLTRPEPPKQRKQQVGQKLSDPFFEKQLGERNGNI
jgi:hypothetical protein